MPNLKTDPYGILEYAIGSDDDFTCFDFHVDHEARTVTLHAVINSETGSFIQDAETPCTVPFADAVSTAQRLVDDAIAWLYDSGDVIEHDTLGWNQDEQYFVRAVECAIDCDKDHTIRLQVSE